MDSGEPTGIDIQRFINPHYDANTYVVSGRRGAPDIVIDPGNPNISALCDWLAEKAVNPQYIVLTHGHADHIAGVEALRKEIHCPVVCSAGCAGFIIDARKNLSQYRAGRNIECAPPDVLCADTNWKLGEGPDAIELIPSPGHTPGSICIAIGGALFTGDSLIPGKKTVTKLPGGDKDAIRETIESLFTRFGAEAKVFPGHGDAFKLNRKAVDLALGVAD